METRLARMCLILGAILLVTSCISCSTCNTIFNTDKLKLFRGHPEAMKLSQNPETGHLKQRKTVVSFCPAKCSCNITMTNQLQVICDSHFDHNFPISALRNDVEILKIVPKCQKYRDILKQEDCLNRVPNKLTVGPNFKYLRLLKVLVITDSQVPNIGTRTLWGLSGKIYSQYISKVWSRLKNPSVTQIFSILNCSNTKSNL